MSEATWTRLAAPFGDDAVGWDVVSVDEEDETALLAPRLTRAAVVARLDDACGVGGWSLDLRAAADGALLCCVEVAGVRKAAAVDALPAGAAATADAALAAAARLFGMRPGDAFGVRRVPYDVVAGVVPGDVEHAAPDAGPDAGPASDGDDALEDLHEADARSRGLSSEGLRMIDRLVERLKDEGEGLAAARLLVRFGGYGKDPDTARELYGALRELLKRRDERRDERHDERRVET